MQLIFTHERINSLNVILWDYKMNNSYFPGQFYRQLQLYREVTARLRFYTFNLTESEIIYINKLINSIQKLNLSQQLNILSEVVFYVRENDISTLKLLIEKPIRKSELIQQSANDKNKRFVD